MTNKILTLKEVKEQGLYYFSYKNGDYMYETEDGFRHLIRGGVDLLEGKKAIDCNSYFNGDYQYRTEDGKEHYIKNSN